MFKFPAIFLAIVSMGAMTNPVIIGVSSATPSPGDTIEVTYNGTLPVTLELDWDPVGGPVKIEIPVGGKAKLKIPANATSLIITDPTGAANAAALVMQP